MRFLCDFCSRSIGSRCNHDLEGVRVAGGQAPSEARPALTGVGGSCDRFAPTLQSVFGAVSLREELARGPEHIRAELEEAVRFNGFPSEEAQKMLDLADEVPSQDVDVSAVREEQPALGFESPVARDRALRHLEARGIDGVHGQRSLVLAFEDTHALVHAVVSLVNARVGEFRVVSPRTNEGWERGLRSSGAWETREE